MNNNVVVCANDAGAVVIPSENNPEYGYIRLEQKRVTVDDNGFLKPKTISALLPGKVEDLRSLEWGPGMEVPGKIIFKEQLNPFNADEPQRHYKFAGETGIVCAVEGQPIYRKTFYSTNASEVDVYIRDENGAIVKHDNGDAIKAAYSKIQAEKTEQATAEVESDITEG